MHGLNKVMLYRIRIKKKIEDNISCGEINQIKSKKKKKLMNQEIKEAIHSKHLEIIRSLRIEKIKFTITDSDKIT